MRHVLFYISPSFHIIDTSRVWLIEVIAYALSGGASLEAYFHDKILKVTQPYIQSCRLVSPMRERDSIYRGPGHLPPASAKLEHAGCFCLGLLERKSMGSAHSCGLERHRDISLGLFIIREVSFRFTLC